MAEARDSELILKQAAAELPSLQTVAEVRIWWQEYYLLLGHRRLGRLLIGRPVESLLGRSREEGD